MEKEACTPEHSLCLVRLALDVNITFCTKRIRPPAGPNWGSTFWPDVNKNFDFVQWRPRSNGHVTGTLCKQKVWQSRWREVDVLVLGLPQAANLRVRNHYEKMEDYFMAC